MALSANVDTKIFAAYLDSLGALDPRRDVALLLNDANLLSHENVTTLSVSISTHLNRIFTALKHAGLLNQKNIDRVFHFTRANAHKSELSTLLSALTSHQLLSQKTFAMALRTTASHIKKILSVLDELSRSQLLNKENLNALMMVEYPSKHDFIFVLSFGTLLTQKNLDLFFKNPEHAAALLQQCKRLKKEFLLNQERLDALAANLPLAEPMTTCILLMRWYQPSPETQRQVLASKHITQLAAAFETLRLDRIAPEYIRLLIQYAEHSQSFALGIKTLLEHRFLTPNNLKKLKQYPASGEYLLEIYRLMVSADRLWCRSQRVSTTKNRLMVLNHLQFAPEIAASFAFLQQHMLLNAARFDVFMAHPEKAHALSHLFYFLDSVDLLTDQVLATLIEHHAYWDDLADVMQRLQQASILNKDNVTQLLAALGSTYEAQCVSKLRHEKALDPARFDAGFAISIADVASECDSLFLSDDANYMMCV